MDIKESLFRHFGFSHFRPHQEVAIRHVLQGEDLLLILPTGSGKSLCYQLPALIRPGLTLVISPLIALMRDQVLRLKALGLPAAALHSLLSFEEHMQVEADIRARRIRLLYISPERLARGDVQMLLKRSGLRCMAIDEAHCLSHWGHHFRPEYLELRRYLKALGWPQTIAVTATADSLTRKDILKTLFKRPPRLLVESFARPNLHLSVAFKKNPYVQVSRWLSKRKGHAGLIYCASRRQAEKMAGFLKLQGYLAYCYHAGLSVEEREIAQDAFLQEKAVVMVATIAFGLGIDRPDVRFVAHLDMPSSLETYYQEVGRAGRDGAPAFTYMLYHDGDAAMRHAQIEAKDMEVDRKAYEHAKCNRMQIFCQALTCRMSLLLQEFEETSNPCGKCDICRAWWLRWPLISWLVDKGRRAKGLGAYPNAWPGLG